MSASLQLISFIACVERSSQDDGGIGFVYSLVLIEFFFASEEEKNGERKKQCEYQGESRI